MAANKSKKRKKRTILVKLVSTASSFFYTKKRPIKMEGGHNGKLRLKKFDPVANKHVWFEEKKI